ncbi:A/G-specific adenine glycosylase [Angelakisella massiliensis]|uniref:A/G-specific adenine glycosylase n=1 Tax=Angelakisella massiliensis TaxID=1871018 RepID=UPI0024B0FA7E|nr:A/G-specific adenine glycosylase [Angelakisella massiliensis]
MEPERLQQMAQPLLDWYDKNARVLPWRSQPTPYRVLVSEIMLQQTRVDAVKPYFARFMEALPDLESLAAAPEQTLLKLWEGLGYYNRVRNLQKAAQMVMRDYGGVLPRDPEELKKLPGIGDYCAGSISSIAYNVPCPAVDGNVLRVITRLTGDFSDIASPATKKAITAAVKQIIPARAGDFNQALMELGALVCLPNGAPLCGQCPLAGICMAREQDLTSQIPVKAPKAARKQEEKTVFLLLCQGNVALVQRPEKGLLAGLWEFPSCPGRLKKAEALSRLREWGFEPKEVEKLPGSRHIFTHLEWLMAGYLVRLEQPPQKTDFLWVSLREALEQYPIPSAYQLYRQRLEKEEKQDG